MKKNPIPYIAVGIILLAVLFAFLFFQQDQLTKHLKKWSVQMDLGEFELVDFSEEKQVAVSKEALTAKRENIIVKITKVKIDNHTKYIEDKKFLLESLYVPTASPYPGVITNVIECPDEFKPIHEAADNGTIYTLFAGERLNYGICAQDLIVYNSSFGFFDCNEKGIFEVRVFSENKEKTQSIILSFQC